MRYFLISLTVIFLLSLPTRSQITLQTGVGIGYVIPSGDFGGSTTDYYNGTKYGLSNGFNLHGKLRAGLIGVNAIAELGYSILSNSENSSVGKIEVGQNILYMKLGPEFQIEVPAFPLTPYIGGNVTLNNFAGKTTFQGVARVPSKKYDVKSAFRLGAGISGGFLYKLNPLMTIDLSLNYNFMNLTGKKWEDENIEDQRLDSYLTLNDDKDPLFISLDDDRHFISKSRSIQTGTIMLSLLFGL